MLASATASHPHQKPAAESPRVSGPSQGHCPHPCPEDLPGDLCGAEVAHLAIAPSSPLQPLHVIDFIDFNLKRFPEAPLGAAQGAVHPAHRRAVGGFPHRGGGVKGQRWDEPPSLRTYEGVTLFEFQFLKYMFS